MDALTIWNQMKSIFAQAKSQIRCGTWCQNPRNDLNSKPSTSLLSWDLKGYRKGMRIFDKPPKIDHTNWIKWTTKGFSSLNYPGNFKETSLNILVCWDTDNLLHSSFDLYHNKQKMGLLISRDGIQCLPEILVLFPLFLFFICGGGQAHTHTHTLSWTWWMLLSSPCFSSLQSAQC